MTDRTQAVDLVGRLALQIDLNADPAPMPSPITHTGDAAGYILHKDDVDAAIKRESRPASSTQDESRLSITLDLDSLHDRGFLSSPNHRSLLADEYRVIKRPMLRTAFGPQRQHDDRDHIVLITSSRPGEGKTFTAINLGMSIASEHDLKVLLIDSDVRRRGMSKVFGVSARKGLMDVLIDPNLSLDDVVLGTNIPHLSILPAGQTVNAPTEILASQRMKTLVADITTRYADRFIIYDAPPALVSTEPGVLAAYVGQVIMVVRANETTKQAVAKSLALVDACPTVNFILNQVTISAGPDRFGYYGSYDEN